MLKAVAASGQIDVGKRWAGRIFEVVQHGDGRIELLPVGQVVREGEEVASLDEPDGAGSPIPVHAQEAWHVANRAALEAYARRIERHGTAAEQLQSYLASRPAGHDPDV